MSINEPAQTPQFSPEAQVIRQLQKDEGNVPCYATPVSSLCNRKECGLRHDCFEEAASLKEQSQGGVKNNYLANGKMAEAETQSPQQRELFLTGR